MREPSEVQGIDYVRAIRLLLHSNPDTGPDQAGVADVLNELREDPRAGHCLVAMADIAYEVAPYFRTEDGIATLRRVLAKWQGLQITDKENQ